MGTRGGQAGQAYPMRRSTFEDQENSRSWLGSRSHGAWSVRMICFQVGPQHTKAAIMSQELSGFLSENSVNGTALCMCM